MPWHVSEAQYAWLWWLPTIDQVASKKLHSSSHWWFDLAYNQHQKHEIIILCGHLSDFRARKRQHTEIRKATDTSLKLSTITMEARTLQNWSHALHSNTIIHHTTNAASKFTGLLKWGVHTMQWSQYPQTFIQATNQCLQGKQMSCRRDPSATPTQPHLHHWGSVLHVK